MPKNNQPQGCIQTVFKTDHGNPAEHALHVARPDKDVAQELLAKHQEQKQAHPHMKVSEAYRPKGFRPPFWDSKLFGEPFGHFNRGPKSVARAVQHPVGHQDTISHRGSPPYRKDHRIGCLFSIEEAMRAVVSKVSTVHRVDKTVLQDVFASVLKKRSCSVKDKVRTEQFQEVWRQLGVTLDREQAEAFFNKYGQDSLGHMPAMVFINALLAGASRNVLKGSASVIRGPLSQRPQKISELASGTKVMYPQCKQGVFAPCSWNANALQQSAKLPDEKLGLEFVHGYEGQSTTSNNMACNRNGHLVYHIAALGVVYDSQAHAQHFFLGHDDDVLCLSMHPDGLRAASGQVAAVETQDSNGEVRKADPCVLIWDSETLLEEQRLFHGRGYRGVQCTSFSPSGSTLISVCTDDAHTMFAWDWRKGQCLLRRKTRAGAPPTVYGLAWSAFHVDQVATFGHNHLHFWVLQRNSGEAAMKSGEKLSVTLEAGRWCKVHPHSTYSACWLPSGLLVSGSEDGALVTWKNLRAVDKVRAHGKGLQCRRPDGTPSFNGIRTILLVNDNRELLTGGGDGHVKFWQINASGGVGSCTRSVALLQKGADSSVPAPMVRAAAVADASGSLVVGTAACDLWKVYPDDTAHMILFGHHNHVVGLATNPNPEYAHVFATCSNSSKVALWSIATHKTIKVVQVAVRPNCLAFTNDGEHLAVGMHKGQLQVLSFHPALQQIHWSRPCSDSVTALAYAPQSSYLAAGSRDQFIYVLDTKNDYCRTRRLAGHSSTIRSLDWSIDGRFISSMDQAYESLVFDVTKGQVSKDTHRDESWTTWTNVLGFGAMGIWPDYSDGTDINAAHRSPCGNYILTSDDAGKVNMFRYPCVVDKAPHWTHGGHSSHVTSVRWNAHGSHAISTGGKDHGVFVWQKKKKPDKIRVQPACAPWALDV